MAAMSDTNELPSKLIWLDLEMTGLDAQKDVILEVAVEITNFDFKTLATYEARIRQKRETVVTRMQANIWWKNFPANRDDFLDKLDQGHPLADIEKELVGLIDQHVGEGPAILAGNSIYNDRAFIKRWMPALDLRLHYRMLDVSAWKVLMQGKYDVRFEKKEVHRAFDDIQASIAELQHYLDWFRKKK